MDKEFCLSDKRQVIEQKALEDFPLGKLCRVYKEENVKEFIKLLKEDLVNTAFEENNNRFLRKVNKRGIFDIIDKLAGEKLLASEGKE